MHLLLAFGAINQLVQITEKLTEQTEKLTTVATQPLQQKIAEAYWTLNTQQPKQQSNLEKQHSKLLYWLLKEQIWCFNSITATYFFEGCTQNFLFSDMFYMWKNNLFYMWIKIKLTCFILFLNLKLIWKTFLCKILPEIKFTYQSKSMSIHPAMSPHPPLQICITFFLQVSITNL